MKKISLIVSLTFLILFSCNDGSDQSVQPTTAATPTNTSPASGSNARPITPDFYPIVFGGVRPGNFNSSYGGGITFGTSFIHYTEVDPTGATDGEPMGGYEFVNEYFRGSPNMPYVIDGSRFAIAIPADDSDSGNLYDIYGFFDDLLEVWDEIEINTPLGGRVENVGFPEPPPGYMVIRGQVVRDHTAPYNASVTSDEYVWPGPGGGTNCGAPLAATTKSNYHFMFYGPSTTSGQICKVSVTDSINNPVAVTSFSLTYTVSGTTCHVTGTVKIGTTTYSFNDTLTYLPSTI